MEAVNAKALDAFFKAEQKKAYCLALRSLNHRDDAMDVVQDAMCSLIDKYCRKPESEWGPLFYRILFNRIRDRQRSSMRWLKSQIDRFGSAQDSNAITNEDGVTGDLPSPEHIRDSGRIRLEVDRALRTLPERQRQAFMMRAWLEFDVKQTAVAMQCSEGSVKTHYSRARHALQSKLGDLSKFHN